MKTRLFESHPAFFGLIAGALLLGLMSPAARAQDSATAPINRSAIPDRPEKLSFPPLVYEPPAPEKYRVALKSGPIAYVVPDRELPLVNLVVLAHTGDYLEAHETVLEPAAMPHPPHRHVAEELFLISKGTLEVTISGKRARLGPGSAFFIASNEEHSIRNVGSTPAQYFGITLGEKAS